MNLLKRYILMAVLQISILVLGPFYYAQSSGDANQQASSCGSGAGSCSAVSLNEATTDDSIEEGAELDAGFPIDIPAPIAKAESGVDPSSLRFTPSPASLISSSQLRALVSTRTATSASVGTLYGAVIDAESLTEEKNVGLIINGAFRETAVTNDGEFQFIIYENEINIALALVVFGENSTADNGGDISAPVITKLRLDPDDNYLLEVSITNVDEETAENGGTIQNLPITFSSDGDSILFNSLDSNDISSINTVPVEGGLHDILINSDNFINQLTSTNQNLDTNLIGIQSSSLELCYLNTSTLSCLEETFNTTENRTLAISPNKNYLAIQSITDNNIDIYAINDLSLKLGSINTPNNEDLADSIEMVWLSNSSLFIIKEINNSFIGQTVDDLSDIISGDSDNSDPVESFIYSDIIRNPHSLENQDQTVFVRCDDGLGTFEICEIILSEENPIVETYLESNDNINQFEISNDKNYLILEIDQEDDNLLAAYGTNTSDEELVYIGYGSKPSISSQNSNLIAFISNQQIGLLNLSHFTLNFTDRIDEEDPIDPPAQPEITNSSPNDAATAISLSTNIEISFDLSMNTTETQNAFTLSSGNTSYDGTYNWNPAESELEFTPEINLIHNTDYTINITVDAESSEGGALDEALNTSFTTRTLRSETIFTGTNDDDPSELGFHAFAVGDDNSVHIVFRDENDKKIMYMQCTEDCNDDLKWSAPAEIHTAAISGFGSLDVDSNGDLHFILDDNSFVTYISCSNECTDGINWTANTIASQLGAAPHNIIKTDNQNGLHFVKRSSIDGTELEYSSCENDCANLANWNFTGIYNSFALGEKYSFFIDSDNTKYVSFRDDTAGGPVVGICEEDDCHDENNWDFVTIEIHGLAHSTSISVSPNGVIHVAYLSNSNFNIKYANCSSNCTQAANWTNLNISTSGNFTVDSIDIESNQNNAIMIVGTETDLANSQASYFVCENGCDNINNWDKQTILQGVDGVGYYPKIDLGLNDKVHMMTLQKLGVVDNDPDVVYID